MLRQAGSDFLENALALLAGPVSQGTRRHGQGFGYGIIPRGGAPFSHGFPRGHQDLLESLTGPLSLASLGQGITHAEQAWGPPGQPGPAPLRLATGGLENPRRGSIADLVLVKQADFPLL